MTFQTKRSYVFEITFSAAFNDGHDMIGVPKAFPAGRSESKSPFQASFETGGAAQLFQMPPCRHAVDAALSADSMVALQYFFADVSRIGAQAPFRHAPIRAEGESSLGHLEVAPAA